MEKETRIDENTRVTGLANRIAAHKSNEMPAPDDAMEELVGILANSSDALEAFANLQRNTDDRGTEVVLVDNSQK